MTSVRRTRSARRPRPGIPAAPSGRPWPGIPAAPSGRPWPGIPAGIALACLALLGACAGAPSGDDDAAAGVDYPVDVESCGVTSTLESQPERIVTMNQGATEVALALGVADRMAGTAYLDDEVPEKWHDDYESVEVLSDGYADHETVLGVEPDLVYGSYSSAFDAENAGTREDLEELGVATYLSPFGCGENEPDVPVTFDSVWDEIDGAATAFGIPDAAEDIRSEQRDALEALSEDAAGEGLEVFWFDSGEKTAFAGAGEGGPQLILDAVGATNVFADVGGGWADVSWERVVDADPDVIVLADATWSTAEDKITKLTKDPALKDVRAVREEAFVTVPFSESTPGVRLADGAVSVAEQLTALR
ncbi:ABC transporter substrate-binding protein [Aeromicrobium sp. CTD01-1L150]|uniref:ABC transporter substrate-binding protein n=1 Tax=Aeromicrobium sp. CTD01-1L150 TaxID=3341830 RepID=UPI0035C182BC